MRVLIAVTHLLGTGHLARALTLGRGFVDAGHTVTVVSGGMPVPHFDARGMRFVQLPPLRSNGMDFSILLGEDGQEAMDDTKAARRAAMLQAMGQVQPDVVITELFPFGRRILRNEFTALLEHARALAQRPLILSSIRDILAPPSKPRKAVFAEDMVGQFYDGILVHSDADVIMLDRSWPVSARLGSRLHYTGFVAPPPPEVIGPRNGPILVSAGGGSVGDAIFATAIDAARLGSDLNWHMMVSGDDTRRAALAATAPDNVKIEAPRADFRSLLARAQMSVSMCGYNTALDVLQTGVPAVLVPFDDGQEVEQTLRAEALSALDGIAVLPQADLTPEAMLEAMAGIRTARRAPRHTGMNGAAETVRIVEAMRYDSD